MNDHELHDAIEDAYADFYDDPRGIHYFQIADRWDVDDLAEADILATAINMGCRDKKQGNEKKDSDEILHRLDPERADA